MTDVVSQERYELSSIFRAEKSLESDSLKIYGGSGSDRQVLEFSSIEMLAWLLSVTEPAGRLELERSLFESLGLPDSEQASLLVGYFIEHGILAREGVSSRHRAKGDTWERWGWRDAFDFHAATTGLRFEKLWGSEKGRHIFEEYMADPTFGPQPTIFKEVDSEFSVAAESSPDGEIHDVANGGPRSLADALLANAPVRSYTRPRELTLTDLATILDHAFGTQRIMDVAVLGPHQQKSYPSGGARHPLEMYVAARQVKGLPSGVYHYDPFLKEFVHIACDEDALPKLASAAEGHPAAETADALAFLTVRWIRHNWKYRYARSYRMVWMEAGHAVQSLRLTGAALGVGVAYSPAINEHGLCDLLGLQDQWRESPLCVLSLGRGGRP